MITKIKCFELQLITNEIYMTTKLTVTPWSEEIVVQKGKEKRKKGFLIFLFRCLDR